MKLTKSDLVELTRQGNTLADPPQGLVENAVSLGSSVPAQDIVSTVGRGTDFLSRSYVCMGKRWCLRGSPTTCSLHIPASESLCKQAAAHTLIERFN